MECSCEGFARFTAIVPELLTCIFECKSIQIGSKQIARLSRRHFKISIKAYIGSVMIQIP